MAAEQYPRRPKFFANRLIRLLQKSCAANEIGIEACWLVTCIALVEDAAHYSKPVTFWTGQLLPITGFHSWGRLDRARERAVAAGWLNYRQGTSRQCGSYWTMIPEAVQKAFSDSPVDEVNHQNGDDDTEVNHQNGDEVGDSNVMIRRLKRDDPVNLPSLFPVPVPENTNAHSSNASESRIPEKLIEFCHEWNSWHDDGFVKACILNPDEPGDTLRKSWQRAQRDREQRERLKSLTAIRTAIAAGQKFLTGPDCTWLTAANLIGGQNTNRVWYLEQLHRGVYADRKPVSPVRASQSGRPERSSESDIWPDVVQWCVDVILEDPEYPTKLRQRFGDAAADAVMEIKVSKIKKAIEQRAAGRDFPLKEHGDRFRRLLQQYHSEEAAHATA